MEHHDHVALIQEAVRGRVWADLGSGTGAFTLALADLLGHEGVIHLWIKMAARCERRCALCRDTFPIPRLPITGQILAGACRCRRLMGC